MNRARAVALAGALLAIALALLAGAVSRPAAAAPDEDETPIANPDLALGCGIDIHVVLDESGSIQNAGATNSVRAAFRAFTSALANTGSRMAVSEFSTVARLPLPGAANRAYTTVTDATIASVFNPYINTSYNPSGSTHWEDAFRVSRYFLPRPSQATPHLVVFITDGDPNVVVREDRVTYDPGNPVTAQNEYERKVPLDSSETTDSSENNAKDRAVPNANALKAQGSHILTVAVGSGLTNAASLARIIAVSGPNVFSGIGTFNIQTHDVYRVPNFDDLEEALREAAFQLCAPSVNIRKLVDANPDPAVDDLQPAQGWGMTATVAPPPASWVLPAGATGSAATSTTGPDGFVNFQWTTAAPINSTISVAETVQPGFTYDPTATRCTFRTPDIPTNQPLPGFSTTATGFNGTVPDEAIVTCQMVNRIPPAPAVDLEKSTNGDDADAAPGPFVPVGSTVTWSYRVTNTGNVPLTGILVTDDQGATVTCPPGALPPGQVKTCTATGTGVLGQYENLGSVRATGAGTTVTDTDPSHYFGVAAGIDIEKATNGADADLAPGPFVPTGGAVTWTYVVRNTGNAPLTGVVVTDDVLGPITCPAAINPLDPAESVTCTATGTAAPGQYENTGSVTGTSPTGPVSDSDVSHYFGEVPAVDIEKLTNLVDADAPPGPEIAVGGRVTWTYRVTNTGNVPLRSWVVTDPKAPFLLCPRIGLIVPGGTIACYSQSTAVEGQYSNTGTVNATSLGGQPVTDSDPSHYFGVRGGIDLVKFTNGEDANEAPGPSITPGDPVNWTYVVTNTGNSTLSSVGVVDLHGVPVSCPAATLAAGASMTCTGTGTAVAGQYSNLAVATGHTPLGDPVRDIDPSHYFGEAPGISLVKDTNGVDANLPPGPFVAVGGPVRWTYIVTNTGNVALSGVAVSDDQGVAVSCPRTTLALDESMTCTATGTAAEGQYANNATVTTTQGVSDGDPSHYFGADSAIRLKKLTNGRDADQPRGPVIRTGAPVTWTYEVRNPGNVLIKSLRVTDNHAGVHPVFVSGDTDGDGDLDPREVWTYEATGVARAGQYANVGTVNGLDVLETPLSDTDPSHYFGSWCTDRPGPPSLGVETQKHQTLPRSGIQADITSDECVDIRTELHPLPRFVRNQGLPSLVGTAEARMRHAGTIHLKTPFFDDARQQINSLDFVCLYLDVFATDPAGETTHVRKFIVLRR